MADDVATRFEVPIESDSPNNTGTLSLKRLFEVLTTNGGEDLGIELTVERATLESVFIKVIRENNVQEEDEHKRWSCMCFG